MKLSTLLQSAPRRVAALGMLAALVAAVALPATALAAPGTSTTTRCSDVQCVISFGDTAISNRLTVLNTLNSKATSEHNAGHLSDALFGSISGDVSSSMPAPRINSTAVRPFDVMTIFLPCMSI